MSDQMSGQAIDTTRAWVHEFIVAEHLCPYAAPYTSHLDIQCCQETDFFAALQYTEQWLTHFVGLSESACPTALLVFVASWQNFNDFLDAVALCNQYINQRGWRGTIQLAHFHPQYCFADTQESALENYSNRAPWPTLHALRESTLTRLIHDSADSEAIVERNRQHLQQLGAAGLNQRLHAWMPPIHAATSSDNSLDNSLKRGQ